MNLQFEFLVFLLVDFIDVSVIVAFVDVSLVSDNVSFLVLSNLVDLSVGVIGASVLFFEIIVDLVSISKGDIFPVLFSFIFSVFLRGNVSFKQSSS